MQARSDGGDPRKRTGDGFRFLTALPARRRRRYVFDRGLRTSRSSLICLVYSYVLEYLFMNLG